MHPVRIFIHTYCELTDTEWQAIEECLTRFNVPANTTLLEEGRICRYLYFLESGLVRFFIWRDGEDISKFFTLPPFCFTSQRSFTNEEPAAESIETLEDSVIWRMSQKDAFDLFRFPNWNIFVRRLIQDVQYDTEMLLETLQNDTAENRYRKMQQENDPILTRVSQKHLASFLGIAPQSLSRIRKKISLENRS